MDSKHALELIVGLGNPGQQYQATRHNAGAMFVAALCQAYQAELKPEPGFFGLGARINIMGRSLRLLFPTTFMNHSGKAVAAISQYYKIRPEHILIAYDELDFDVGTVRLKTGGGHGGHNGVRDIIKAVGDSGFHRLRIGIGHPGDPARVLNHVLGEPSKQDAELIHDSIARAIDVTPLLAAGEWQTAMNRLHTRPEL
ncbi:MAG: aminoacyl-tRNA hydrolase [Pseudomonadales bacterium]|nr:aminoacyl-tRNA hydrolase [Pseudomonadales bacterium]